MDSDDLGDLLDDLQKQMDRCKVLFEQYFLGIQRTAPGQLHVDLERRIRKLTQLHIRNTGQRFRFTTLSQRFTSYNTYWKRTMRQIEAGTYVRDMARLGRKAAETGKDVPDEILAKMPKRMRERILKDRKVAAQRVERTEAREQEQRDAGKVRNNTPNNVHHLDEADLLDGLDLDAVFANMVNSGEFSEQKQKSSNEVAARENTEADVDQIFSEMTSAPVAVVPPRPVVKRAPPAPQKLRPAIKSSPAVKPPPGMSEPESRALYQRYKKARDLVGADTSKLSYDKLMRSLNKQAPKILKDHNAQGISFNVVVKGDRVVLKAKPKK